MHEPPRKRWTNETIGQPAGAHNPADRLRRGHFFTGK
jgi:hypothetical protein